MYEHWQVARWETPVSNAVSLAMVSLIDEGQLSIILQDLKNLRRRRFKFAFTRYPAYRNIPEEYRTELWEHVAETRKALGWTFTVTNSDWVISLRQNEPMLDVNHPHLTHYVIGTEDDVIEILSPEAPSIQEVRSRLLPSNIGKSRILHHPHDHEEIKKVIQKTKHRHK